MSRRAHLLISAVAPALLVCGCPSEEESFDLTLLQLASSECENGPRTGVRLNVGRFDVRLTFMRRPPDELIGPTNIRSYQPICDRLIDPKETAEFQVNTAGGTRVAVRVEAFDAEGKLAWFGQHEGIDLAESRAEIQVRPPGFSCVPAARRLHAFHSATLLPNGQVLLVGGVLADAAAGDNLSARQEAFASGSAEIFDPTKLEYRVAAPEVPPRVFHRAMLLPSPAEGPYRVLLIGGLTPGADGAATIRLRLSRAQDPFLLSPHETAKAAPAALLTVTPDPVTPKLEYQELEGVTQTMFPAIALSDDGSRLLIVGGAGNYVATEQTVTGFETTDGPVAQWLDLTKDPPAPIESLPMVRIRVGHAVARINGRVIALGGAMDGPQGSEPDNVFSALANDDQAFVDATPSGLTATAWHTFTPFGITDAELATTTAAAGIWAGGYPLAWQNEKHRFASEFEAGADQPRLQLVTDPGSSAVEVKRLATVQGYTLSAYHDATRLHDGRLMITGGNQRFSDSATPYQALYQVAVYRMTTDDGLGAALDPFSDPQACQDPSVAPERCLRLPRFGHRSTRLLDNAVLLTGGITYQNGTPKIATAAELIALRDGAAAEDPFEREGASERLRCDEIGQSSSAMKIVARPETLTDNERRSRTARGPSRSFRVRIADETTFP